MPNPFDRARNSDVIPCSCRLLAVAWVALAYVATGCDAKKPGFERYVPKTEAARSAVSVALSDWREGYEPRTVAGSRPQVCVVDNQRKAGQRLTRFEFLGEVGLDNARGFAVRLTLADPEEQKVARFLALGTDPVWVFRQEDYENIAHWMHKMDGPVPENESKTKSLATEPTKGTERKKGNPERK
jgi:hypothetical protein